MRVNLHIPVLNFLFMYLQHILYKFTLACYSISQLLYDAFVDFAEHIQIDIFAHFVPIGS